MVGQKDSRLGQPVRARADADLGDRQQPGSFDQGQERPDDQGDHPDRRGDQPGNSGGPLLNSRGQVIGMNTAIVSHVGQSAGISFAVPINAISRILGQLIENGRVIRADLGITKVYATGEGIARDGGCGRGPGRAGGRSARAHEGRADRPRLRSARRIDPDSADLIVAVDHKRVRTVEELLTEVEKHRPGENVRLTVVRDGQPVDIVVRLGQS